MDHFPLRFISAEARSPNEEGAARSACSELLDGRARPAGRRPGLPRTSVDARLLACLAPTAPVASASRPRRDRRSTRRRTTWWRRAASDLASVTLGP
jgi:hypothetical protein